jgi:hypothetical protein
MRAVGVTTSPLRGSPRQLALRARQRHRVCRLLSELRPRLAQSSAVQSDRPAAADGRVCFDGRPRPASVRSLCAPAWRAFGTAHHLGTWPGRRCLTPDVSRHVHFTFADAPQATRPLRCVPGASHSRDRRGTAREHGIRCRPHSARRDSRRRVSQATHAAERGPRDPNEAAADCEQSLRLRCSDGKCDSHLCVCAFAD